MGVYWKEMFVKERHLFTYTKKYHLETQIHCFFQTLLSKEQFLGLYSTTALQINCPLTVLATILVLALQIKSVEFVDDLADPNRDKQSALGSNAVLEAIQHDKRLTFSAEKCELLKINSKDDTCLKVNGRSMKQVDVACYLGDHFNRQLITQICVKKES